MPALSPAPSEPEGTAPPAAATAGRLRSFQVVVAAARRGLGIGAGGRLPWSLPGDMAHFKEVTTATTVGGAGRRNAVVMGRRTWESIPWRFRPLPGRLNVVLTRDAAAAAALPPGVLAVNGGLDVALALLAAEEHAAAVESVFVIGGGQVYRRVPASPLRLLAAMALAMTKGLC
eukprot:SM000147S01101  [mRNA]  locus=s147:52578:53099:+ [translate_table: standard]